MVFLFPSEGSQRLSYLSSNPIHFAMSSFRMKKLVAQKIGSTKVQPRHMELYINHRDLRKLLIFLNVSSI